MEALANAGKSQECAELLETMKFKSLRPEPRTFTPLVAVFRIFEFCKFHII